MEWKYRTDFQVMPGVMLKYGKNGLTTEIKATYASEKELLLMKEKLTHQLYKPYEDKDAIKSASTFQLTSESLNEFKALILSANQSFGDTQQLIESKSNITEQKSRKLSRLNKSLLKFFFKKKIHQLTEETLSLTDELNELKEQLKLTSIEVQIDSEDVFSSLFNLLKTSFVLLKQSQKKWDFTSSRATNRFAERTSASSTITRSLIDISEKQLPILSSQETPLCFHNVNGGDVYFYPGFLIVYESKTDFALINYTDLHVEFRELQFIENEQVPSDSKVIGETWFKTNKDGSPDKRFASNYKIPIALYGEVKLTSSSGLNELYCFSNVEYAQLFYKALFDYADSLKKAAALLNAFN